MGQALLLFTGRVTQGAAPFRGCNEVEGAVVFVVGSPGFLVAKDVRSANAVRAGWCVRGGLRGWTESGGSPRRTGLGMHGGGHLIDGLRIAGAPTCCDAWPDPFANVYKRL